MAAIAKRNESIPDDRPSRFWRIAGLVGGGLLMLIVVLTLLQCSLKKPQAPTWDSSVTVPLASDHFTAANLILRLENGDQYVDDSGQIGLLLVDTLAPVSVGTDLTIPDQFAQLPQVIGQVNIDPPALAGVRLDLADYYAGPAGSIPPLSVSDVDTIGPIREYTWMAPAYGDAYLRLENQFGVDFDSIRVTLNDLATGPLGIFWFPAGVPSGGSDSQAVGLVGRQIYNEFEYVMSAWTDSGTVLSLSNRYLDVAIVFTDTLVIDSALMEVPAVTRSRSENVAFSGNADLLSVSGAELAAGTLVITVDNRTELAAGVNIDVPSLTQAGVPLSRSIALPASDTTVVMLDLTDYTWVPEQTVAPQYFVVNASATTVPSAPAHVLIRQEDSIYVSSELRNVAARSVTGVIAPQTIGLPSYSEALNVPPEFTSFHLTDAALSIELENGSGIPADLAFAVTADNGNSLNFGGLAAAGSPAVPALTVFTESNLATLLDPFPTRVDITTTATFGDSLTELSVTSSDYAAAIVTVRAPLSVRVDSVTITGEVGSQLIEGTDVDGFTNNLLGGALHLRATNHFPLGASVTLLVATDSAAVYSAPNLTLGPVVVAPGRTDSAGLVAEAVETLTEVSLTETDLQLFDSTTLYIGQYIHFDGTGGQAVQIVGSDYLDLVAYFVVTMRNGGEVW